MKFLQLLPYHSVQSYHSQGTNAIRILQSHCFNFDFLFHQFDRSATSDILTIFSFQWSRKTRSFYIICHTTVHNLTAVNEQIQLEFCNLSFVFHFLYHQCDNQANADIFNTF